MTYNNHYEMGERSYQIVSENGEAYRTAARVLPVRAAFAGHRRA